MTTLKQEVVEKKFVKAICFVLEYFKKSFKKTSLNCLFDVKIFGTNCQFLIAIKLL